MEIRENVPLAPLTTIGVGGCARYFAEARTVPELVDALGFADQRTLPILILGGGSNLLVSDDGFDGLVIRVGLKGTRFESDGENVEVIAGAGVDWDTLVSESVDRNLAGLECLSGIPGFVGGTPIQNVGAYGQEVADTIAFVRCLDRQDGAEAVLTARQCGFSYRTSLFNTTLKDRYVVLEVGFRLRPGGPPDIRYKDMQARFSQEEEQPSLAEVRQAVLEIRRAKSMVVDPNDPNSRSAGSFFKNPIVSAVKLDELRATADNVPFFAFGDSFKVPAAWLIEHAGYSKGFGCGNAAISENHTLAIVNRGGASSAEIIVLMRTIQEGVSRRFGIDLMPEPTFVGFDKKKDQHSAIVV